MEQFGPVDYAVLCKATIRDITAEADKAEAEGDKKDKKSKQKTEEMITHKGTGFVRFQSVADAKTLLELSQSLE